MKLKLKLLRKHEQMLDLIREIAEKHKKIEEIKTKLKDNYEKMINLKV
ncbi:MAG: hypothetical protein Q8N88_01565 [Nanoarchaeota archaeon]|nr:hypothetical protein [Nanoarchaeota archaeon]